ncbi:MAG: trypsin-like peptidase domain-containing protein [Candidatus Rokubacteria bacterium]|nr:trypsin-like peptidase domain-containing protein [Candidatus Rokubacteria bacterium]
MTRRGRHALVLVAVVSTLIPAWCLAPIPPAAAAQLEQLVANIKPAVVLVQVKKALGGRGHGSGFVYDASGFILTNHHVVEGATEIVVRLPDGRWFPASVAYYDRLVRSNEPPSPDVVYDVAVLKINASKLPVLPIHAGDAPVQQGQEILILGYPGGVPTDQVSVTRGIVSAIRDEWIQTDAVIVPGNSGGPAIDQQGRVIGLATFVTGPFYRIGGIVSSRYFVGEARDARRRDHGGLSNKMYVTGMDYMPRVFPPPRDNIYIKSWSVQYDPETAAGPRWTGKSSERVVGRVEHLNGALRYRTGPSEQVWPRDEISYYIDSTGLYRLGGVAKYKTPWDSFEATFRWESKPPRPILLFRFPPVAGDSWEVEDHWEPGGGMLARARGSEEQPSIAVKGRVKIDSVNEVVTVPAGTFKGSIKITQDLELAAMRGGGQVGRARLIETTWYGGTPPSAPAVGAVRVVGRLPGLRRWTMELLEMHWNRPRPE